MLISPCYVMFWYKYGQIDTFVDSFNDTIISQLHCGFEVTCKTNTFHNYITSVLRYVYCRLLNNYEALQNSLA